MPTVEKSITIGLRHRNVASVLMTGLISYIYVQSNLTGGNMSMPFSSDGGDDEYGDDGKNGENGEDN